MAYTFDREKAVQEAAFLVSMAKSRRLNYTVLLKMLYIADRVSIQERGYPMSGDRLAAMPKGPVLSTLCDLVRGSEFANAKDLERWENFFHTENHDLVLDSDPGTDELSEYEIERLTMIFEQFVHRHLGLIDDTHEFGEWVAQNPGHSSETIPIEDIVRAVGRMDDLDEILELRDQEKFIRALIAP